jgi:hypothetical protein
MPSRKLPPEVRELHLARGDFAQAELDRRFKP